MSMIQVKSGHDRTGHELSGQDRPGHPGHELSARTWKNSSGQDRPRYELSGQDRPGHEFVRTGQARI
jgi:hypothetical protein